MCRTRKEDRSVHGYGLKSLRAVARKYRGELLLQFPDGSFSAAVALQMPD
ncbi:MAG: ATP-binding protein [Oscillibacter sp.]|nr:ATP-binding protein [Oscillibacter sp.]